MYKRTNYMFWPCPNRPSSGWIQCPRNYIPIYLKTDNASRGSIRRYETLERKLFNCNSKYFNESRYI